MPDRSGYDLGFRPETYWAKEGSPPEERSRKVVATGSPFASGLDDLPDFLENEVEIAWISLQSTSGDVISVRARREGDAIRYRIADDFGDGEDPSERWAPSITESRLPLTMAEFITLLDNTVCGDPDFHPYVGLVLSRPMDPSDFADWADRTDREDHRDFSTIHSDVYPQLAAYYEEEIDDWVETGVWRGLG